MNILVTGGTGFIGKALVLELANMGHNVSVFALDTDPDLEKQNIIQHKGDLADQDALVLAMGAMGSMESIDAVFHTAARTGTAGSYHDFYLPNVQGTENVLKACLLNKVPHLIYTGSPSTVFDHKPIEGLSEDECAYPHKFASHYERTKAIAEQLVAATGKNPTVHITTIIVRPHLVYGPGDTNLLPRLEQRARNRKLVQIGKGKNLVSLTHISNTVRGHLCALESLISNPELSGRSYFICDADPVNLWEWIRSYLSQKGIPAPKRELTYGAAYLMGGVFELIWKIFKIKHKEPPLTRFVVDQLAMSHYYSLTKARQELGYEPETDIPAV